MVKNTKRSVDAPAEESVRKRLRSSASPEKAIREEAKDPLADDDVGFTLKLADEKEIRVCQNHSKQLQDSCAFFRNAFRHGTLECQNRVIAKPDWTVETASAILELIREKTFAVPANYAAFKEAADQILLPIRILHPVSGTDVQNDLSMVQSIANTWNAATTTFTIDMTSWNANRRRNNALDSIWEDLLTAGTVFTDDQQKGLQIQLIPDNPADAPPALPANLLKVGCFAPLAISVYHTCHRLCESLRNPRVRREACNNNKPACMALPLYCGGKQLLEEEFNDMEFLQIETNNVPTVTMTRVTHNFSTLRQVLQAASELIAPVHLQKLCYLLIPEPSIQLLGKLITACQSCRDDPNSIGWDLEKNQFCTLKTWRDTKLILECLQSPDTQMATSGTIRLVNVDMTAAPVWSSY